jgi:hypothetical protein
MTSFYCEPATRCLGADNAVYGIIPQFTDGTISPSQVPEIKENLIPCGNYLMEEISSARHNVLDLPDLK